ncbi:Uncharacterised protein [uncultured archaeon]|nr:Uncharacterised protein [uncultured archaeon]
MRLLEQLKAVHAVVDKEGKIQVHRKLHELDDKTRTLVDIINLA